MFGWGSINRRTHSLSGTPFTSRVIIFSPSEESCSDDYYVRSQRTESVPRRRLGQAAVLYLKSARGSMLRHYFYLGWKSLSAPDVDVPPCKIKGHRVVSA